MLSLTILLLLFCLCRLDLVDNEEMSSTTSKNLNAEFSTHIESETSTSEMMTSFRANYVTSNAVADTTTGNGNRNWTGWLLERNLKYCGRTGVCNGYRRRFCEPCERCYCDDDCSLYDDCCADFRLINPEQKSQFSCISILYRGIPSEIYREKLPTSQGYRMISSCPDKNHDLSASCRNSPLLGPVTGFDNKTTYKNINCARCNDIQRIQPWQLSIGCSANIGFTFNSKEEMVEAFSKNPNCSVSFSVPDHTDVRRCFDDSSTITKCNVTGQWERFDESVEAACSRYTAVKIVDGQKYANPFCYLCNAANDSKLNECVKGKRQVFPKAFSVLLDFENDQQPTPPVKSRDICSPDEIYDNNKKLCRKIYCSYGKQFKNNLCAPIFDKAKGLAYRLYFRLSFSNTDIARRSVDKIMVLLERYLFYGPLSRSVIFYLEVLALDFRSNSTECARETNVAFFLSHVVVSRPMLVVEFENILLGIGNMSFNLSGDNNTWSLSSSRESIFVNCVGSMDCFVHRNVSCIEVFEKTVYDRDEQDAGDDAEVVYIPVDDLMKCPQIILETDEFQIDEYGSVNLDWKNKPIPRDQYRIEDDGMVRICLDNLSLNLTENFRNVPISDATPVAIVSVVFTTLSLICLILVFVIYCVFESLRSMPGLNNMNLIICLWLAQFLYVAGSGQTEVKVVCKIMGVLIHYFWLTAFCAMNVCSFHMYHVFTSMRNRDDPSYKRRLLVRYSVYIYGVPALIVAMTTSLHSAMSNGASIGYGGNVCYLSSALTIGVAFATPVGLIVVMNIAFFIYTVRVIKNRPNLTSSQADRSHVFVYVKMSSLTGFTWLIGFIAIITQSEPLIYIFIVINASQGVFLFLSFACNARVLELIKGRCKCVDTSKSDSTNSYSMTTTSSVTLSTDELGRSNEISRL